MDRQLSPHAPNEAPSRRWPEPSPPVRYLLLVVGTVSVGFGVVGIFLPMWPTTPFLLLATACYIRASARLHDWLINHPRLGSYVRDYISGQGMPIKSKVTALTMLWVTLSSSFVIAALRFPSAAAASAYIATLSLIGAWVHWYIGYRIPTKHPDRHCADYPFEQSDSESAPDS